MTHWVRRLAAPHMTCSCGHQMVWSVPAGGWVCGYCPNRR